MPPSIKKETAIKIGRGLLQEKLIACYNLLPVESGYWWKGKITQEKEFLLILKTKSAHSKKVEEYIKKHHTYKIPEIVTIKPFQVNRPYLTWLKNVTTTTKEE